MMTKLEAKNILEDIMEAVSVAVDSIDVGEDCMDCKYRNAPTIYCNICRRYYNDQWEKVE